MHFLSTAQKEQKSLALARDNYCGYYCYFTDVLLYSIQEIGVTLYREQITTSLLPSRKGNLNAPALDGYSHVDLIIKCYKVMLRGRASFGLRILVHAML